MTPALGYLVGSIVLCWAMVLIASLVRAEAWAPAGLLKAFGNRDDLGDASALAGRMDRAAKNMLENLLFFGLLVLTAHTAGKGSDPGVTTGAMLFFWARVVYAPLYWAGVKFLRTGAWAVAVIGLLMIGRALV